jgi:hypothetical protein
MVQGRQSRTEGSRPPSRCPLEAREFPASAITRNHPKPDNTYYVARDGPIIVPELLSRAVVKALLQGPVDMKQAGGRSPGKKRGSR